MPPYRNVGGALDAPWLSYQLCVASATLRNSKKRPRGGARGLGIAHAGEGTRVHSGEVESMIVPVGLDGYRGITILKSLFHERA